LAKIESGYRFMSKVYELISEEGITKPSTKRSRLNLFTKLLFVKVVISGAFIGQMWVKREREESPEIPIFDMLLKLCSKNNKNRTFMK
jgi:hypothetical protein